MGGMLEGKTVVVTGGSSGIGRGIALVAARHGAKAIVVADLTEEPREGGLPTAQEVKALGAEAVFHRTDVSKRDDVDALVEACIPYGGVDVMACNAGIMVASDGVHVPATDVEALMAVNLYGVLYTAQAAIKQMLELKKKGSVVIMSSGAAFFGHGSTVAYAASKGAVVQIAKSLADGVGPMGIRVNAVCPGVVDTVLVRGEETADTHDSSAGFLQTAPLRRIGEPAEVGEAVAWLGSDCSSYVTGVALPVDGGLAATR
jgi:L-rhamnose 1-dehydrogenase